MREAKLLKQAAQCRDLAATAFTDDARIILLELADGYERCAVAAQPALKQRLSQTQ